MEHDVKRLEGTECKECSDGIFYLSRGCGVYVCDNHDCEQHHGLVRCYCGWYQEGHSRMDSEGNILDDY